MFGVDDLNELISWSKLYFNSNSKTDTLYFSSELTKIDCLLYSPHINSFPDSLRKSVNYFELKITLL